MFSLKTLVAAIALGTALLVAPATVNAAPTHRTTAVHPLKHTAHKHKPVHRKHASKHVTLHAKHTASKSLAAKHVARKTSAVSSVKRHHPNL